MPNPSDNGHPDDHRDPGGTVSPTTIGIFTDAARPAGQWTVTWDPATHEVTATRSTRTVGEPGAEERTLARVPAVAYVNDLIEIIRRSPRIRRADEAVSFDDLAHWLTRLDHALADTSTATVLADTIISNDAFYIDYGHVCGNFDPTDPTYTSPELWGDLNHSATHADQLLHQLAAELHDNGNLAAAAAQANELAIIALAMHIALQEAYSTTHWRAAAQSPTSERPGSP